jgi:hypothetical protein
MPSDPLPHLWPAQALIRDSLIVLYEGIIGRSSQRSEFSASVV